MARWWLFVRVLAFEVVVSAHGQGVCRLHIELKSCIDIVQVTCSWKMYHIEVSHIANSRLQAS